MTSNSVSPQKVPSYFLQEASELLQQMDIELQTLHQDFDVQKVYALMRVAHTLKGAAASVGLDNIKTTTHSLENVFRALCAPDAKLTPAIESLIFEGYGCLQLLLSAQTLEAQIDESSVLDRMAKVVSKLENHLGSRFGQDGYLPTSSELGVDITQSVFEKGVNKRLEELEEALKNPDPKVLTKLLQTHGDIFNGLAESFDLPGFAKIVQTTLTALDYRPDLVVQIAQIALEDYRVAQTKVLEGDRTQGGGPSLMLQRLATPPKSSKNNWFGQVWNVLNQPIPGTAPSPQKDASNQTKPRLRVQQPAIEKEGFDDLFAQPKVESAPSVSKESAAQPAPTSNAANVSVDPLVTPKVSNLKVSIDHLEQINYAIGDLLTQQNRQTLYNTNLLATAKTLLTQLGKQQQQLSELQSRASAPVVAPAAEHRQFDPLEFDRYSDLQLQIQTSLDAIVQQIESAEAIELYTLNSIQALEKQQRIVKNLRETLVKTRMQPISNVFDRFHQVLGRLRAHQGKPAELKLEGSHVLVDKMIIDKLYEPLLHLVRNAFDHGIEPSTERQQQGKQDEAQIHLSARQEGQRLLISVRDNGRGLDLDAIRQKAINNHLIAPTQPLSPTEISNLVFKPGFSTSDHVDELSGRGFGLDAVRAQMQALQAQVTVTHQASEGACFTLEIPTNLTIAKLLLCQASETLYTFMTDAIEQILIPKPDQLSTRDGSKLLSWQIDEEEHLVPVVSLSDALNYSATLPQSHWQESKTASDTANPILLMQHQEYYLGLECHQLLGEQELVIRSFGEIDTAPSYLYGCSILPDGRLSLVVDGAALTLTVLKQSSSTSGGVIRKQPKPKPPKATRQSILVIDDSITVRNTLAQGLQKAGYIVNQAKEGNEALQKLEQENVSVILCDLEMPGMNGFEFLKARQQMPHIASIPTIMLTSRTGDKHRQLAQNLGATDYMTKPYLIPQLLETINDVLNMA
ncbi:MAG: hybrid sensor histidine kinase/response regulator [Cyanobacteria bacterium P01_C01_bin.118]